MKKTVSVLMLCTLLIVSLSLVSCEQKVDDTFAVIYTNDVHCGFEDAKEGGETVNTCVGVEGIAGYKAVTEKKYGKDNVWLVDSGDFIQGEAIGTISNGKYPVDIMNELGYDAATLGNHEFDYGMDALIGVDGLADNSKVEYVACNFKSIKTGENIFAPYVLLKSGRFSIAFIGIVTPETFSKSTPAYFRDENGEWLYSFCQGEEGHELYDAVQAAINDARDDGADYVVALSHLGIEEGSAPVRSTDVIANTDGLDALLDGHSHSVIENRKVENMSGEEVVLTSTGTKLENIGSLVINTRGTKDTSDDEITAELLDADEVDEICKDEPRVEAVKKFYAGVRAEFDAMLSKVVAESKIKLSTEIDVDGKKVRIIRNSEAAIGNLCADAYRQVLGADIGMANGGGIRSSLNIGDITFEDIINIHPYGNSMCLVEVSGQEILDALEVASVSLKAEVYEMRDGEYYSVGENGSFLHVSGMRYTVDPTVKSSVVFDENGMMTSIGDTRRVIAAEIEKNGEYAAIDPDATYTLASHDYMIKFDGNGHKLFSDNKLLIDSTMLDNQLLIKYIQEELEGVITAENTHSDGERITVLGR